jgi:3alpha(or 20beta)-hydroxysteroid dehydrogenase
MKLDLARQTDVYRHHTPSRAFTASLLCTGQSNALARLTHYACEQGDSPGHRFRFQQHSSINADFSTSTNSPGIVGETRMGRLDGKVIIVTGGTRGMGEATARGLVREGAKVVFTGRDAEAGRAIEKDIGDGAVFVEHDVGIEGDWVCVVAMAMGRFGKLTGLINNAGRSVFSSISDMSISLMEAGYKVNQLGPLLGMKHAVGPMRRNGGGSIVNIGSGAYVKGHPHFVIYGATKGAIVGMSRAAAAELAAEQIRVNVVHPGFFVTDLLMEGTQGAGRQIGARVTPMGRAAEPEEIVGTMLYLMSDESSFVTGAELVVDSGYTTASGFNSADHTPQQH